MTTKKVLQNFTTAEVTGKNIEYYRKTKNISQEKLAELLGVSPESVGLFETGKLEPDLDILLALCCHLDISLHALQGVNYHESIMKNAPSTIDPVNEMQELVAWISLYKHNYQNLDVEERKLFDSFLEFAQSEIQLIKFMQNKIMASIQLQKGENFM
jgi:DNA-binding XRE family transcriptional regulator